jgi:hypothetical protein
MEIGEDGKQVRRKSVGKKKVEKESEKEIEKEIEKEEEEEEDKYGQNEIEFIETKKDPPKKPTYLLYTNLNSKSQDIHDPSVLPIPLVVTLKHTYFSERKNLNMIGISTRYKEKFCTLVLYKPTKKL